MAYKVGDFTFETEAEAEVAQKESQAIAYITKQIDLNNPEAILATYQMMISKELFHTALGIAFLQEVHDMLMQQPGLKGKDIPEVPEQPKMETEQPKAETDQPETKKKKRNEKPRRQKRRETQVTGDALKYKKRSEMLSVICGTMLVIIIAMFVISATSEHPTILNYEEKIVNKYAAWEEELNLREQELNQREQELQ